MEIIQLLVNLTEEGMRYQSRAVSPMRRAGWLRYDTSRRAPAVIETHRLLKQGFWLDSLCEVALAADAFPKVGFSYPVSREAIIKAGGEKGDDGLGRLNRYLEAVAAFTMDAEPLEFLRGHGDEYRSAVAEFESSLSEFGWLGSLEQYFGLDHRSYLCVASLLLPAGFGFGMSLNTPEGLLAFYVSGPFIEDDGRITFAAPLQAVASAEREFIRAFVRPVIHRNEFSAESFARAFSRERKAFANLGYHDPLMCLEDHLVFAAQSRLLARRGESAAAAALIEFDETSGYRYIRLFSEALEDYEMHRTDFPSFEAFFGHLMDSFPET